MSRNIILDVSSGELTWDIGGAPVIMGPTTGGILVKSEMATVDIMQDGYGDTPVDSVTKGRVVTLEINMSEITAVRLALIQGVTETTGPVFTFDNSCGVSLLDLAKRITIKPMVNLVVSVDTTEWFTFFKCSPPIDVFDFAYNDADKRIWKAIFKVFPDDATGNVGKLYAIGE